MAEPQKQRLIEITTPLKNEQIILRAFNGHEEMSRLFHFDLEFVCTSGEFTKDELIADLVGKNVTIRIDMADDSPRFFNGFISRVVADYGEDFGTVYRAEMIPWLWFLTQTSDCRIFQNLKTPDIIKKIFSDLGFNDTEFKLNGEYREWDYCVQYRETDFNFISRLMEQEGMFYYFKHDNGKHIMVISDSTNGYYDLPQDKVAFPLSRQESRAVEDHITDWERRIEFVTGKFAHTDYDFENPSNDLMSDTQTSLPLKDAKDYEIYDYPGEPVKKDILQREIKFRMEEEETTFDSVFAASSCRSFSVGGKFQIYKDHPIQKEIGQKYVITSINHFVVDPTTAEASGQKEYSNTFVCIPDKVVYRPKRLTPKPNISGIQTAVVVGPKGEEIYTDKYGRIKVQFYWDREGKRDENSSLWIRCAQAIAGKKWGFMAIPRIGQEVVIEFLEGDPDRPLVVGCVYNGEQMPPYDPTEEAQRIYLKSNSTKGGEGFNELMFDDKADNERFFMHAEKDMDVRVKNDSRERIIGNRHQIIGWEKDGQKGGDQNEKVWQDKNLNIKRNQIEHIEGNWTLMVGNGEAENGGSVAAVIEKKLEVQIGDEGSSLACTGDSKTAIQGSSSLTVDGDVKEKVGGGLNTIVIGDHKEKANNVSLDSKMNINTKAGMAYNVEAGMTMHLKAGITLVLEGGAGVCLKSGGSFVTVTPAGVMISGPTVLINSGGAALSGSGTTVSAPASPDTPNTSVEQAAPADPAVAHNEKTGFKSAP
jgi:type VI secretion system secreted protein VgrG